MADIHYILLFGLIATPLIVAVLGAYLGKRENNSVYTALMLFVSAGLWISLFISTDQIIVDYTEPQIINTEQATETIETIHMNSNTGTTALAIRSGSNIFAGEELGGSSALLGDNFNSLRVSLAKIGSVTGTIFCGVWDNVAAPTSANYLHLLGTADVSTFSVHPTYTEHWFNGTSYTLTSNDVVGCFFNGGGVGNEVGFLYHTADTFDSTNSFKTVYGGSFTDSTTQDFRMAIVGTTEEEIPNNVAYTYNEPEPIFFDFSEELKYMYLVIAAMTSLIAATTVSTGRSSGGFKPFDKL